MNFGADLKRSQVGRLLQTDWERPSWFSLREPEGP